MKIFYFSDAGFIDMKENFENSFKDNFDRQYKFLENVNVNRDRQGGGIDIWKYKTEMIIEEIKNNIGNIIVVSDIDIIFYRAAIPTILECMRNNEMCFQRETSTSGINIGFISIYCNENTLRFWTVVLEIISKSNRWDQEIVNDLLYNKKFNIKWSLFPSTIWAWSQGGLSSDIILHHANCVKEKEGKLKQLKYVSNFMARTMSIQDNKK